MQYDIGEYTRLIEKLTSMVHGLVQENDKLRGDLNVAEHQQKEDRLTIQILRENLSRCDNDTAD